MVYSAMMLQCHRDKMGRRLMMNRSRIISSSFSNVEKIIGNHHQNIRISSYGAESYLNNNSKIDVPKSWAHSTPLALNNNIASNNQAFSPICSSSRISSFSTSAVVNEEEHEESLASSFSIRRRSKVRNVAIVAHVDHGKTTLVDELLKAAASTIKKNEDSADNDGSDDNDEKDLNRLMDSGELEMERGITITSKVTRLDYNMDDNVQLENEEGGSVVINVVDTPGHADFAGEVDRILSMVDGVCLIVDAAEGPKSQTKYVLSRALSMGLHPICILNKCDRPEAILKLQSGQTETELLELFDSLNATDEQMEYTTLYSSAKSGWCTPELDTALDLATNGKDKNDPSYSMQVVLNSILTDIPPPSVHVYDDYKNCDTDESVCLDASTFEKDQFSMAATTVGYDPYLGRTCTGRIYSGSLGVNDSVMLLRRRNADSGEISDDSQDTKNNSEPVITSNISGLFCNRGVSRAILGDGKQRAVAGDIITLAGVPDSMKVGDSLTSANRPVPEPISTPPLAPPTLSCLFGANNGPLVGQEGTIVTSSKIRARLISETDNNVTLTVETSDTDAEKTVVFGRGELQLGILIEQMRREGYEMIISPPAVVTTICPNTGKKTEPYEEVVVDVDAEYAGSVIDSLTGARKGVLVEMIDDNSDGKTRLLFEIPSRGLLGFHSDIATSTRGTAVVHHCYLEDRAYAGALGSKLERGKLVSCELGKATLFALASIAERGTLFVEPGDMVYPGMVIGEYNKGTGGDLEVNPVRAKATSNIRTVNKDEKTYLPPPKKWTDRKSVV